MLELTTDAAMFIRQMRREDGVEDDAVVRITGAGGSRLHDLHVSFIDRSRAGNWVTESRGVPINIATFLRRRLDGMVLDVTETQLGRQLILRRGRGSTTSAAAS
jgi:Fe-S cluster assembly iron-binding protein IscA